MVKKKAPIALDSINALEKQRSQRTVDRSERVAPPGAGIKDYEVDTPGPTDKPSPESEKLPSEVTTLTATESLKPATDEKVHPEGRGGRTAPKATDQKAKKKAEKTKETQQESGKPHALSVPLRIQEYKMYSEIIDKINALGLPKKVAGTDVQRASIHLLHKMAPEKILKAHLQSLMALGSSAESDEKKALSVLLQPREHKMFSKIINKINVLGLSKKIKGTDVQRASIYLLHSMKAETILKAHYKSLMP